MKGNLYILIVLVSLCNVYAQSDGDNNFSYPCKTSDEECIRNYFFKSGDCEKASHTDAETIPDQSQNAYFSKSNITVLVSKANVTYLNPQIRAFYINEDTKNLVFAVEFDAIIMDSEYSTFRIHQVAKEPFITGDAVNASYPVILTAIIPIGDRLTTDSIKGASVTAYIKDQLPKFKIGNKVFMAGTRNPGIFTSLLTLYLDIPTAIKEAFLTGAPHFFALYLQKYFCDFGISLNSSGWGNTIGML